MSVGGPAFNCSDQTHGPSCPIGASWATWGLSRSRKRHPTRAEGLPALAAPSGLFPTRTSRTLSEFTFPLNGAGSLLGPTPTGPKFLYTTAVRSANTSPPSVESSVTRRTVPVGRPSLPPPSCLLVAGPPLPQVARQRRWTSAPMLAPEPPLARSIPTTTRSRPFGTGGP